MFCFAVSAPLDLKAAHRVNALGRKADVAHHGNSRCHEVRDEFGVLRSAFELDRVRSAFFDKTTSVGHRLVDRGLIRHEGHVANDVGSLCAASNRAAVVNDFVQRHRQRGLVALYDHAEGVANEEQVNLTLIQELGKGRVVRG